MKMKIKRISILTLCICMILPMIVLPVNASEVKYKVNDIVEFGYYPQSEVKDEVLLKELNAQSLNWISYNYYVGTGDLSPERMQQSDYMKYADVTYNGNKYRAVIFSQYRPYVTAYTSENTAQVDNGYYTDTVYWFKYEPLEWRILDPDEKLMMCERIIDSQAFNNLIYDANNYWYQDSTFEKYANDYATSSIRAWLNDDFYNTAFTEEEKSIIEVSTLDNTSPFDSKFDSETTYDKVFLLSYNDILNENYGFNIDSWQFDYARRAHGTDYAKCQGLASDEDNGQWWLRSPYEEYSGTCFITSTGSLTPETFAPCWTCIGTRPVLRVVKEHEFFVQEVNCNIKIQEPSKTRIFYKDMATLYVEINGDAPAGAYVEWTVDNDNFDINGMYDSLNIRALKRGYTTFTANLYDLEGNVVASDTIELYSNSGLFAKIYYFMRNIFVDEPSCGC